MFIVTRTNVGNIGETYVAYKLALRSIKTTKLSPEHQYDILTAGDIKIEVKTAKEGVDKKFQKGKQYEWRCWQFLNVSHEFQYKIKNTYKIKRKKKTNVFDYIIFICLDKKCKPVYEYIVPFKVVKGKESFTIRDKALRKIKTETWYDKYLDKWDFIKQ